MASIFADLPAVICRRASERPDSMEPGPYRSGVMAQFYQNEEFITGRRFDRRMDPTRTPREMAIAWAEQERIAVEADEPATR